MPSDLAAERGEPSYVWRSGQERRLHMVEKWANLKDSTILEVGSGIGTYSAQFRPSLYAARRGHRNRSRPG